MTTEDALRLLGELGATPWLVRHHELVLEAARMVCDGIDAPFDPERVLLGAALHDAGKVRHPGEMSGPGHEHEAAGRALLRERGVADDVARFCETHARWDESSTLEDLLVALADKLWKGKRVDELDQLVVARIAREAGREAWEVFSEVDAMCEAIAAGGAERLARSVMPWARTS